MSAIDYLARWRVRIGYVLAVLLLWLARPTPQTILIGALVGLIGLIVRAYAAGYLHKQEVLTTTGPYAYTRNPLYFGSSFLALGAAIAMRSLIGGILLSVYFTLIYSFVMKREERELRIQHPDRFDSYAASVPLFFPQLRLPRQNSDDNGSFSWRQYKKNHEYEAAIGFLLLLIALALIWRLRVA